MFQYFITVVPTRLNTYKISADTHQFSVTERVSNFINKLQEGCTGEWRVKRKPGTSLCYFFFPGAGDKPRSGQSRRFRHLCEVRHQLSDGDGQRAAHATVAVPGATVRHHRGNILHHRQVWCSTSDRSYFDGFCDLKFKARTSLVFIAVFLCYRNAPWACWLLFRCCLLPLQTWSLSAQRGESLPYPKYRCPLSQLTGCLLYFKQYFC